MGKPDKSEWIVIQDWLDEDFGHVQLEWHEEGFILWRLLPSTQSKIGEKEHRGIFTRRSDRRWGDH